MNIRATTTTRPITPPAYLLTYLFFAANLTAARTEKGSDCCNQAEIEHRRRRRGLA